MQQERDSVLSPAGSLYPGGCWCILRADFCVPDHGQATHSAQQSRGLSDGP